MTKDEALRMALEALDCIYSPLHVREIEKVGNAMKAIRKVLAQPEQEPVATVAEVHMSRYTIEWTNGSLPEGTKLYTTPPQRKWVGLTDEEIVEVANAVQWSKQYHVDFARAIESLLWAKNS